MSSGRWEAIPRKWQVIETVHEKFSCRRCDHAATGTFHATPGGFIEPKLLATILFDKFVQHIPLNHQSQCFKCEGIDLGVSALADRIGAGVFAAMPLYRVMRLMSWRRNGCMAMTRQCRSWPGQDNH